MVSSGVRPSPLSETDIVTLYRASWDVCAPTGLPSTSERMTQREGEGGGGREREGGGGKGPSRVLVGAGAEVAVSRWKSHYPFEPHLFDLSSHI